jgi:hypothetical protein
MCRDKLLFFAIHPEKTRKFLYLHIRASILIVHIPRSDDIASFTMFNFALPPDYLPPRKVYHDPHALVRDPASVPIGFERANGGSKFRYQILASGSSSRPSSTETVADASVADAARDTPTEPPSPPGDGDVRPNVGLREDTDVNQSGAQIPELARDYASTFAYHNGNAYHNGSAWFLAGPSSRENSEQTPHNGVPSVDRPSGPLEQVASTSPEQSSQRKREEAELNSRFDRPQNPHARIACMRQHMDMLTQRADHVCSGLHCFDETCTIDLPGRQGCRFADSFHSHGTAPCVWGWGLMMRQYARQFGERDATTTSLDEIARWHRQRCTHAPRFEGPALVRDPPEGSNEMNVIWVINPSE